MSIFTMWALSYLVDGEELLAGKYVTHDQAEQAKKAIEADGVTAWITEETWDFGPEGAVRIDEHSPDPLHPSWRRLIASLADTLSGLTARQSLSLSAPSEHWVQFRAVKNGLRAEAVSNGYLDDDNELTPDQEAAMEALGWLPPFDDEGIERAQNYYQELAAPVTFVDVAALAVHTLAYVYGVAYPQDLTYIALDGNKPRGERDLTFPDLGVAAFRSDEEVGGVLTDDPVFDVQEHLLDALRETDPDVPPWDNDGLITLRFGSAPVSLRVVGDPPIIRICSPVLADVTESVHLLRELNDINAQITFARLFLTSDGTIIVAGELHGLPFVAKHLLSTLTQVGYLADSLDERLRVRHGGTPILRSTQESPTFCPYGECDSWKFTFLRKEGSQTSWRCDDCGEEFSMPAREKRPTGEPETDAAAILKTEAPETDALAIPQTGDPVVDVEAYFRWQANASAATVALLERLDAAQRTGGEARALSSKYAKGRREAYLDAADRILELRQEGGTEPDGKSLEVTRSPMGAISVVRVSSGCEPQRLEFDGLSALERDAATWSWSADDSVEIRSDAFGDGELIGVLPVSIVDPQQDDTVWDVLDLPLGDDGFAYAHVAVNGFCWFLVQVGGDWAWVPLPFWEYPYVTIYELSTSTVGGYEWGDRLYQVAGLAVRITIESHFDSRTGGVEELSLEPGTANSDVGEWIVPDPDPPDDQLQTVELTAPGLDPAASELLATSLAAGCAPGAYVKVNETVIETDEDPDEE